MQYTIGDDVISQTYSTYDSGWTVDDTQYLLYDGHGRTFRLAVSNIRIKYKIGPTQTMARATKCATMMYFYATTPLRFAS